MTGARPNTWMPFYWADYRADTSHLSAIEHGGYILLIGHYWTTGKPLPLDDGQLSRIAAMTASEWRKHSAVITAFFTEQNGSLTHARIDKELAKAISNLEAHRAAGKLGGRPKQSITKPKPNGLAEPNQIETPLPSPSPVEKQEEPPVAPQGGPSPNPAKVKRARGPKPVFPIDPDRQPDEKNLAYALKCGVEAEHEWPKFVNWCIANAILSADFGANWRTRCDNIEKRAGEPGRRPAGHGDTSLAGTIAEVARSIDRGRAGRNPDPAPEADHAPRDGRYSNDGRGEPVTIDRGPDSTGADGVLERDEDQEPGWTGPETDGGEVCGRAVGISSGHRSDGAEGLGEGGSVLALACGDQEGLCVAAGTATQAVGESDPLDIPGFLRR